MYVLQSNVICRLIFASVIMDMCLLNAIVEGKDISSDSEEMARRKKATEKYFDSLAKEQEDWIETYHLNVPQTDSPTKHMTQKSSLSQDLSNSEVLTSNSAFHSSRMIDSSDAESSKTTPPVALQPVFSRSVGKVSPEVFEERRDTVLSFYPKLFDLEMDSYVEIPSSKLNVPKITSNVKESATNNLVMKDVSKSKIMDSSQQKSVMLKSDDPVGDSIPVSTEQKDYFPASEDILTSSQNLTLSESNNLDKPSDSGKDITDQIVKDPSSSMNKKDEIDHRSLSSNAAVTVSDEIVAVTEQLSTESIPLIDMVSEGTKRKSVPTNSLEIEKLEKKTCSVTDTVNDVSDCLNVGHSNTKVKASSDIEKTVTLNKETLTTSNAERNIKIDPSKDKNTKKNSLPSNLQKRQGNVLKNEVDFTIKACDSGVNDPFMSLEFPTDQGMEEYLSSKGNEVHEYTSNPLHHRQMLTSQYFSALIQEQKDWVESYHSNYVAGNLEQPDPNLLGRMRENEDIVKQVQTQERKYFTRWINKLQNKFVGHSLNEHTILSFSFSADLVTYLEQLSSTESFDIILLDEVICRIISNATFHSSLYLFNFNFASYVPSRQTVICAAMGILLCFVFVRYPRYKLALIFVMAFIVAFLWHGFKMYQQKIAQKHALMSSVESSYCVNILSQESGVFAHLKEYFRQSYHGEECKKYYEALMVDPLAELSLPIVLADLVSSTFLQAFNHLGVTMNTFFKDLMYDLSLVQKIQIVMLLIVVFGCFIMIFAMYQKCKINLPFYMGSIEPTVCSKGSRVEEVVLDNKEKYLKDTTTQSDVALNNCTIQTIYISKKNNMHDLKDTLQPLIEECHTLQPSKILQRRLSL